MVVDPDGRGVPAVSAGAGSATRRAPAWGGWPDALLAWRRAVVGGGRRGSPEGSYGRARHRAARCRQQDAVRVFDEYARWVALGVANLISLLDPDVVALGGGVAAVGDEADRSRVRTILSERFPGRFRRSVRVDRHHAGRSRRRGDRAAIPRPRTRPQPGPNQVPVGAGTGGSVWAHGVPPDHRPAAVRLHDHRLAEGGGPARGRGHHRPGVPQPRPAVPGDRGRELCEAARNERNHRYSSSRGIPNCARRPQLLPPPLRRGDRPRHRGDLDHRRQGGLQPPDVGAAREGRRRARAVAQLPDPHLRPFVRRGQRA